MPKALVLALLTLATLIAPVRGLAAAAPALAVETALQQLNALGTPVLYSSDLSGLDASLDLPTTQADGQAHSADTLRRALVSAGYQLNPSNGVWLVTRVGTPTPDANRQNIILPGPRPEPDPETLIVTGSRHQIPGTGGDSNIGSTSLFSEELGPVPALAGDAIRVVNRLPGMASLGVSAKPRIRGGLQDEVLVRMDGLELLDPYHLSDFQSIVSAIDARTVDAIDVYTGGFPARYGNRMSGVMDIATRRDPSHRSELGVTLYQVFANTTGASADGDSQWLGSLRRGDLSRITSRIDSRTGTPEFSDGFARLQSKIGANTGFTLGGLFSNDDVKFSDDEEQATSDISSRYLWLGLDHLWANGLNSSVQLTQIWSERNRQQQNIDPAPDADSAGFLDVSQKLRSTSLHSDLRWGSPGRRMELGLQAAWGVDRYRADGLIDTGELATALGRPEQELLAINTRPDGWSGGLYWSADLAVGKQLSLQPGLRYDVQTYTRQGYTDQLSPRLGARWRLSPALALRASVGRYIQPEALHELQVQDGLDQFNSPQRSNHVVLGFDWRLRADLLLRLEAYSKTYQNLKVRHENLYNPFVLLPELEPDRIRLAPDQARVRGFEAELGLRRALGLSAWLRYSHLDAEDHIDNRWVRRRWSQRHTVQAIGLWRQEHWDLSAAVTWHSGWFTTAPPSPLAADERLVLGSILNNQVMRNYLSIDLSASRRWQIGKTTLTLFGDLTNTFDRNNIGGIDFDIEESDDQLLFTPDGETVLPLIPTAGISLQF